MGAKVIRRILVVEDDLDMREALHALLGCAGFRVALASNGVEAWELLGRGPRFSAILLDLHTPRMTGNDLVARVRRTPRLRQMPIIAMSGERRPDVPAAQVFLQKPFSREQLVEALVSVGVAADRRAAASPAMVSRPPARAAGRAPRGAAASAHATAAPPAGPGAPPPGRPPRP